MHIIRYPEKGRFSPEGVVVAWDKTCGNAVKNGDILVQIEAFGELIQFESPAEGVLLETLAEPGRLVSSGQPLAVIGNKGDDASKVIKQLEQASAEPAQKAPKGSTAKAKPTTEAKSAPPTQTKKEDVMTPAQSTGNSDNVTPILMPQAGQSMEEGTILSWKIKEGDTIKVGQVIMEIETDKATMEVEATDAGRVARIVAAEGDIVEVKKPVAFIADNDADVDAYLGGGGNENKAETAQKPAPKKQEKKQAKQEERSVQQSQPSGQQGQATPILMPQAGQSMEEGTILSWKVKEGDTIEVGQVIMEIETDKATMEVEAVDAGRIAKIVAGEGDILEVKQPVAYLAEEGVDVNVVTRGADAPSEETEKQAKPEENKAEPLC